MSEDLIQLGDGIVSQIERASTETAFNPDNSTVVQAPEQVLGIEQPEDSSPLSEEEAQILEQAVEEAHSEEDTVEGENTEVSANNSGTNTTQVHQEIPANSETLLIDDTTSRFSSAIWYENIQKKVITLAGVGGIGRFGNLINF